MSIRLPVRSSCCILDIVKYKPVSCLIHRRLLAPLERQIVMNLLWLESSIPAATMAVWVYRDGKKYNASGFHLLSRKTPLTYSVQAVRKCSCNPIKSTHHLEFGAKTEFEPYVQVKPSNGYHWRVGVPLSSFYLPPTSDLNDARGEHRSFGIPAEKDEKRGNVSVDMLDAYAVERWEVTVQICPSSRA